MRFAAETALGSDRRPLIIFTVLMVVALGALSIAITGRIEEARNRLCEHLAAHRLGVLADAENAKSADAADNAHMELADIYSELGNAHELIMRDVKKHVVIALSVISTAFVCLLVLMIRAMQKHEEELRVSNERYRQLIENALVGVAIHDGTKIGFVNESLATMLGYSAEELIGMPVSGFVHPSARPTVEAAHRCRAGADALEGRYQMRVATKADGYKWMDVWTRSIDDGTQTMANFVDITEQKEAHWRLEVSEQKFRVLTEGSLQPTLVVQQGRIAYCNAALAFCLGFDEIQCIEGKALTEIVAEDDREALQARIDGLMSGRFRARRAAVKLLREDGTHRWHDVQLCAIIYEDQKAILATSQDITELKMLMEELDAERLHDSLTGLFNRRYYNDVVPQDLGRYGEAVTLLMLDVDGFKHVNDMFGHPVGDQVLQTVAVILQQNLREEDTPIRFGGDEFLVVMPGAKWARAEEIADRLAHELVAYLEREAGNGHLPEGVASCVWLSGGAATYRQHSGMRFEEVLRAADERMYEHKEQNRIWRENGECPKAETG